MNDVDKFLEELRKRAAVTGAPQGLPFDAGVNAWMIDNNPNDPVLKVPTPSKPQESSQGVMPSNGVTDTPWSSYAGGGKANHTPSKPQESSQASVKSNGVTDTPWSSYAGEGKANHTPSKLQESSQASVKSNGVTDTPWSSYAGEGKANHTPSKPQESSQAAVKSNGVTDTPWSSYAGGDNDDNVIQALEKLEKKVVPTPAGTELDYLNQFTDAYTPAPLTKEEQERRTRAANAVAGVGALGNAANAISNLIFAGKGAPSQTLPQTVDASAGIRELNEAERVRRNEIYQRAKERIAEKRAQDEFKQNQEIKMAEFGLKAQESQMRMAELAAKMDLAIQRGETEKYNTLLKQYLAEDQFFKNSIAPALAQLGMSKTKSEINENNAQAASSFASANASNARAERTRRADTVNLYYKDKSGKGKGVIKIRKSDWDNAGVLGNIADSLGLKITWDKNGNEAYIAALPEPLKGMEEKKGYYTKEQIQLIIGEALNQHPNAEEIISEYGADVEEYSPKGEKRSSKNEDKEDDKYPKYEGSKDK